MSKPMRILCIDDEVMMLNAYKRVFRDESLYSVSLVEQAIDYDFLDVLDFDIVICDQRMPGMLGTEVLKHLCDLGFHGKK